jgi:4'-phosphopantetheinyl transferase
MNAAQKNIFHWPEMPPLPPLEQAVLIRVATSPSRPIAREELRKVLRQILAAWSDLAPEQLPLRETSRGPVWRGRLGGHSLDISLSYADGEGWIGLIRGGQIGVDAMKIQPVAEAEAVARLYLGQTELQTIQQSANPTLAFAAAWTKLEARVKCLKLDLDEWSPTFATTRCAAQSIVLPNHRIVAVATRVTARNVSDTFAPVPILFLDNVRAKSSPSLV